MTGLGIAFIVTFIVMCVFLLLMLVTGDDDLFMPLALTAYIVQVIIGLVMIGVAQETPSTDESTETTEVKDD